MGNKGTGYTWTRNYDTSCKGIYKAIRRKPFNKSFIVAPFDTASASQFAKIWGAKKSQAVIEALVNDGKTKAEIKTDGLIVATAIAHKAECIYSHDNGVKRFALGYIDVQEMPFVPVQASNLPNTSASKDWGKLPKRMDET